MNRRYLKTPLVFLLMYAASAHSQDPIPVSGESFEADFYQTDSTEKYGVIVLAGTGGGKANDLAEMAAKLGHSVLALSYYDPLGSTLVPETLEMIPLEYFEEPKQWLMARDDTRDDGVILFGLSKGAELALVLASQDSDYKAVVGIAPSKVVWQGVPGDIAGIMAAPSSWSFQGNGLPFVPYISSEEQERLGFTNRHAASLTNSEAVQEALIQVENIESPMLLLSGGRDQAWPSAEMAAEICERANSSTGRSCSHVVFEDGGHLLQEYRLEVSAAVERFFEQL